MTIQRLPAFAVCNAGATALPGMREGLDFGAWLADPRHADPGMPAPGPVPQNGPACVDGRPCVDERPLAPPRPPSIAVPQRVPGQPVHANDTPVPVQPLVPQRAAMPDSTPCVPMPQMPAVPDAACIEPSIVLHADPASAPRAPVAAAPLPDIEPAAAAPVQPAAVPVPAAGAATPPAGGAVPALFEFHVRRAADAVDVVSVPWRLAPAGALSYRTGGAASMPSTAHALHGAAAPPAVAVPAAAHRGFAPLPPLAQVGAPQTGLPAALPAERPAVEVRRGVERSGASAAFAEPWVARLLRWIEREGHDPTAWIRDYRLGDGDAQGVADELRMLAQQHGLQLERIVVNARVLWHARADSHQET